jgi:glycosyltransferase involved in cell wall biosynthesis
MTIPAEPFVSVLTPVYNGADYLSECIESVLNQSYTNFEYIIIDNCSTDASGEIARSYASRDSRIRVLTNDKFVGVIENHNIGFRLVSQNAKYCKVVSADDYLFPDCLRRLVRCGEENPSVGLVGSYQLSGEYIRWQGFKYPTTCFPGREVGRRFFLDKQVFIEDKSILGFGTPTSMLYRADLVRRTREFYPNASPHADTSACFQWLQKSDFGFVYEVLSYERTHPLTQSSKSAALNRYLSAGLNDVLQYGRFYLDETEVEDTVYKTVKAYHRFLALAYLGRSGGKEFWEYHQGRLRELGYPLRRWHLIRASASVALEGMLRPRQAWRRLRNGR